MKTIIMNSLLVGLFTAGAAFAATTKTTCTIKGMDCGGCVDMVTEKVCGAGYEKCDVSIRDKAQHLGQVVIQASSKVDPTVLEKQLAGTKYTVEKCR